AINDEMTVVSYLHLLASHSDHALNIELVLDESLDAFGFKDDDLSALRWPEIVAHAVHEQMVTGPYPQVYDVFTGVKGLPDVYPGPARPHEAVFERLFAIIRREPYHIRFAALDEGLPEIEDKQAMRRRDLTQNAVRRRYLVDVRGSLKPFPDA